MFCFAVSRRRRAYATLIFSVTVFVAGSKLASPAEALDYFETNPVAIAFLDIKLGKGAEPRLRSLSLAVTTEQSGVLSPAT